MSEIYAKEYKNPNYKQQLEYHTLAEMIALNSSKHARYGTGAIMGHLLGQDNTIRVYKVKNICDFSCFSKIPHAILLK